MVSYLGLGRIFFLVFWYIVWVEFSIERLSVCKIGDFVPGVVIRLIVNFTEIFFEKNFTEIRRKELLCFIPYFTIFSPLSL